jgi:hypothetical protein
MSVIVAKRMTAVSELEGKILMILPKIAIRPYAQFVLYVPKTNTPGRDAGGTICTANTQFFEIIITIMKP